MTNTREENAAEMARDEARLAAEREQLVADSSLTAQQLNDKYKSTGGREHPVFNRQEWRDEVANENTTAGYWDWLAFRITLELLELEA